MAKKELLLEIAVIRPTGYDARRCGSIEAKIDGHVVVVDRDARSLAQSARRLTERCDGVPVVSIITNEADPQLIDGVSGQFKFRTGSCF